MHSSPHPNAAAVVLVRLGLRGVDYVFAWHSVLGDVRSLACLGLRPIALQAFCESKNCQLACTGSFKSAGLKCSAHVINGQTLPYANCVGVCCLVLFCIFFSPATSCLRCAVFSCGRCLRVVRPCACFTCGLPMPTGLLCQRMMSRRFLGLLVPPLAASLSSCVIGTDLVVYYHSPSSSSLASASSS